MSFHESQITSALGSGNQWSKTGRVGGHDFPAPDDAAVTTRLRALEDAVISLDAAVRTLARELQNLSSTLGKARADGRI